jgi:predicted HTH transcriptional regulator
MASTPPWEWKENDLLALQRQQVPERLDLEYKRADSLENAEKKKSEISKDVSAMANSAGGIIIYGVAEDKETRTVRVSGGIDPAVVTTEWLEQVISSRIQRRIDGVRINQVPLTTVEPGKVAYVVSVPQSTRAPHMAFDNRFYKRR